jgi:exonuclease III
MDNIKILFWNSNGINHEINKLRSLAIQMITDIILLNETRLSPSTRLHMPNYFTYRNDLPPVRGSAAHGGTAVLVHRRITHQQTILNTAIQTTSVLIKLNDHEVLVSAVYKPPGATLTTNDLDLLTKSAEFHISAGDFMSNTHCGTATRLTLPGEYSLTTYNTLTTP